MSAAPLLPFLDGDKLMARLVRGKDGSGLAPGLPQDWQQSLRSVVNLMLGSPFPMAVIWHPMTLVAEHI